MIENNLINTTEPLKREDFDNICRCCLSRNPMANIFQLKFNETFLVDIFKLFNAQVNWDDDLPKNICALCTANVINFYKFKQMYDKSVETLQNISRNSQEIVKKKGLQKDVENENIKVEEHETIKEELGEEPENENNNKAENTELLLATNKKYKTLPLREEAENENIKDDKSVEESQNDSNDQENLNHSDNNATTILKQTQKSDQTIISPKKDKYIFTLPYFSKTCNKWISARGTHKHSTPKKRSHVCEICGKGYLQKAALKIHYRIHKLISLANDEKVESDSVFDDTTKQKKKSTYQCSCDETFNSSEDLIKHKKEKNHQDPLYRNCEFCNKTVNYKAYCRHVRCVHFAPSHKKSVACEYCGLTYSSKHNLKQHIKIHTGEKSHVCEFCGKGFTQKSSLECHRRAHTGEKPFVCEFCGKLFIKKSALTNHRRVHTGEKPYLCDNCGKAFQTRLGYNKHIKGKHHDKIKEKHDDNMEVQCEICSKILASPTYLKQHMIQHGDGEKNFLCVICKKDFHMKNELDSHMITHTDGEKKFICNFCGKGFLKLTYLKLHESIHTGQKNYTCKICFKAFRQRAHLAVHMRTHTGEKPYGCPYCDKSFAHITTRIVHVRLHTGERPYVCDVCSKGFYHSSSMTNHRQSHFKNRVGNKLQEST